MNIGHVNASAKFGLHRIGKRVLFILQFESEYEAIRAFEVWSMDEVKFQFNGPKITSEEDGEIIRD